ncbi:sel1 repeat family protein [Cronobacter turicensis]
MRQLILLICLLLAGCNKAAASLTNNKDAAMNPLTDINARLVFTCKHEIIPESSEDSNILFNYARWLQKNNQLKEDITVDAQVERLYRIAAANGNYKASINLQNGSLRGRFHLSRAERIRMIQKLIDAGIGSGYYFIAIYLQHGAGGLQRDEEMALRYYRKAADEGNSQAQTYVGEKLAPVNMAPEVSRQLLYCAAEQGEGDAAMSLGHTYVIDKKYKLAVEAFQLGVAAGHETAAFALENGFGGPEPTDSLYFLDLKQDSERARRYQKIGEILGNYSYAHPTVPEINDIVPLPPAPLPAWDGKLKWVEEREANIPPPKPSEALIAQLAKAKMLNPATGKPLPSSPDFERIAAATLLCRSGEPCPKSGYWQIAWIPHTGIIQEAIRYFHQGDIMPTDRVERVISRPWPLKNMRVTEEQGVDWRLVGEA